jgi:hypothetical protein
MPTEVGIHGLFARITANAWKPTFVAMTVRGRLLGRCASRNDKLASAAYIWAKR